MAVQKKQLGEVLISKLDSVLSRIETLEEKINELHNAVSDSEEFLLEQIDIAEDQDVDGKEKRTRRSTERELYYSSDESELCESSIRIYDLAEKKILQNKPRFLRMVQLYNEGVKKKEIHLHMNGRPYHSYDAVCRMLRVGIRRGYLEPDGDNVVITEKFNEA